MSIAVSWHAAVCLLALAVGLAPVEHLLSRSLGSLIENSVLRGANAVDQRDGATSSRLIERVHGLPMTFQASDGETDAQVDFTARGRGYAVFLTAHEAVVLLTGPARSTPTNSDAGSNSARLHVRLIGALAQPRAVGLQGLPGTVNDLLGDDPARWHTSIATYGEVGYREIYSGIDLAYGGDQRQLESRFVVRPGADPASIVFAFEGAEKIDVDREGNLRLQMDGGVILQRKPVIYQDVNGARQRIAGAYVLKGGHEVGISVANYDRSASLVINPVLFYSTYLGGTGSEEGGGIAVDADGYVYVTGRTPSIDFPASAGAFQPALSGVEDVFVTKLDPAGSAFLYSTYLGGTGIDTGQGIAVDVAGNAYLSGETASSDFPTTPGALQTIWPGRGGNTFVPFVAKLNPTGSALVYSTYLSGSTDGQAPSLAVDSAGNAYVTGQTTSSDFPTTVGAFQRTVKGQSDAFVAKLNATGSALVYSTLLGGGSTEHGRDIAIDGAGYAYVTGRTSSSDFPTTAGAFQTTKRSNTSAHAAWVTKLNPTGTALAYSTYVAGTGSDRGVAIAIDTQSTPSAYISGRTSSTDFPTTAGAFQTTSAGARDAFVAKLNPAGSALVFSTYLGGAADDESTGISVGADGSAYVSGETASSNFPTTAGAIQGTLRGLTDSFVTRVDPSGSALAYSTYLGGSADDSSTGIAVDALGSAYVTGVTTSTDFPTTAGAFDTTFTGVEDAFVARIAEFGQPATLTLAPNAATGPLNTQQCVTATVQDATGRAVPGVTVRFSVAGANSTNGSARTDGGGQATFCYTGTQAGDDTITSFADTNKNGAQDGAEPSNIATKTWTFAAASYVLSVAKTGTGTGTVTSSPTGIDCGTDCTESYASGAGVVLTAIADASSTFTGWSGDCAGTGTCTLTIDAAKSVTAAFTINSYTLTVGGAGGGTGVVSSSPPGISCNISAGSTTGGTCSAAYDHGTVVALTATPSVNSNFGGWSGACSGTTTCSVTMDSAKTVTATFDLNTYTLSVSVTGNGTVTSSPGSISCTSAGGSGCSATFGHGTAVTLTATPDAGNVFASWSGDCGSFTTDTCSITMDGGKSATATFATQTALAEEYSDGRRVVRRMLDLALAEAVSTVAIR